MDILEAMEIAATKQAGETKESWWPYEYEAVHGGILVKGSAFRIAKRGLREGERIPVNENFKMVFITKQMIDEVLAKGNQEC